MILLVFIILGVAIWLIVRHQRRQPSSRPPLPPTPPTAPWGYQPPTHPQASWPPQPPQNQGDAQAAMQMAERTRQEMAALTEGHQAALDDRARRAVAAARGSFAGHVAETAFPFVSDHPYHPKDIVHIGGTMDYLVFDGLYEIRTNGADPSTLTVVLVEVKWGNSRPSQEQQAVMQAVNQGRARAEVWTAKEEGGRVLYRQTGRQLPS